MEWEELFSTVGWKNNFQLSSKWGTLIGPNRSFVQSDLSSVPSPYDSWERLQQTTDNPECREKWVLKMEGWMGFSNHQVCVFP